MGDVSSMLRSMLSASLLTNNSEAKFCPRGSMSELNTSVTPSASRLFDPRQGQRTAEEGSQRERYPRCCQTPAPAAQDRSHVSAENNEPVFLAPIPYEFIA